MSDSLSLRLVYILSLPSLANNNVKDIVVLPVFRVTNPSQIPHRHHRPFLPALMEPLLVGS